MPASSGRPRLLLVEDEPSLVLTLGDRLRSEGYDVESASDGNTGCEVELLARVEAVLRR